MPSRSLPVRPNLDQLKHQAKDLLKAYRAGDLQAAADFATLHPDKVAPARAKLADAQLVVARSYHASSWTRLVQCCELINAIWDDDLDAVERLVNANPNLLTDTADIHGEHWGPPMRSAAFLQRRRITRRLDELGASGLAFAFDRAGLRDRLQEALGGAAYTLSVRDTEFVLRMGARVGQGAATPVEAVIGSDSRRPADKRRILAIYEEHGYVYPGTPVMAFHRGRFDLLEQHLARDPGLLSRRFAIQEIFPPDVGCGQQPYEAMGTPVDGGTLLHLAVYWDELDMATWLLDHGADPNARAAMDADGFGGFTPLFNSVVSQAGFWINYPHGREARPGDAAFTELLLSRGADPGVRASIRMRLGEGHGDTRLREFRDVTPLEWGRRFSREQLPGKHRESLFVNTAAMRLLGG
jgi:ankyrin repeat protein